MEPLPMPVGERRPVSRRQMLRNYVKGIERSRSTPKWRPNLDKCISDICVQVNKVWNDVETLEATCDTMNDIMNDLCPVTTEPHSARRQEFLEMQQNLARSAHSARDYLQFLKNSLGGLRALAANDKPKLVHETLLLEKAILEYRSRIDRNLIKNYDLSGTYVTRERDLGVFIEDRAEILDGSAPHKLPMGPIRRENSWARDLVQRYEVYQDYVASQSNHVHKAVDHPLSEQIADLRVEQFENWDEDAKLAKEIKRLEVMMMHMVLHNRQPLAYKAYLKVVRSLLHRALALQGRIKRHVSHCTQLRLDYEAGPRTVELNNILQQYDTNASEHQKRADENIKALQEVLDEGRPSSHSRGEHTLTPRTKRRQTSHIVQECASTI